MGMPCILPGHAENVRKCIEANVSSCVRWPIEDTLPTILYRAIN